MDDIHWDLHQKKTDHQVFSPVTQEVGGHLEREGLPRPLFQPLASEKPSRARRHLPLWRMSSILPRCRVWCLDVRDLRSCEWTRTLEIVCFFLRRMGPNWSHKMSPPFSIFSERGSDWGLRSSFPTSNLNRLQRMAWEEGTGVPWTGWGLDSHGGMHDHNYHIYIHTPSFDGGTRGFFCLDVKGSMSPHCSCEMSPSSIHPNPLGIESGPLLGRLHKIKW